MDPEPPQTTIVWKSGTARRLGVSQWARQLVQGGARALRRRSASGRPARLIRAQKQSRSCELIAASVY